MRVLLSYVEYFTRLPEANRTSSIDSNNLRFSPLQRMALEFLILFFFLSSNLILVKVGIRFIYCTAGMYV